MRIHSLTSLLIPTSLILPTDVFALQFSWLWPMSGSSARRYQSGEHRRDPWVDLLRSRELPGISASEVESLFLNTQSLNPYTHKPDCFKRAAGRIRSFCGDFDNDGMNEEERIHAAIAMTLCEIHTARQPPPLECVPFSSVLSVEDHASHWDDQSDESGHERNSYAPCVSALSRSPQSWSSYSGYLREVPQLCHAFRRWNDIDTARKIYTNITLEKLSLLRHLHLREERWEQGMGAWVVAVKDLQDVMQSLTKASANREEVVDQFGRGFDETLVQFRQSLASIKTQEEVGYKRSLSRVDEELARMINRHEQSLFTFIPTLEHTLSSYLTEVLERNAEIFEFGDTVRAQWTELEADFATMYDSLASLTTISTTISTSLTRSQALSHSILNAQLRSHDTMTKMGEQARDELGKINETAVQIIEEMKERERVEKHVGWLAWNAVVQVLGWIGRGIWGVDHMYIDKFSHSPVPRIALSLFTLLWYLFRSAFSSLMSVLVVLISSKRFFSGIPSVPVHKYVRMNFPPEGSSPLQRWLRQST